MHSWAILIAVYMGYWCMHLIQLLQAYPHPVCDTGATFPINTACSFVSRTLYICTWHTPAADLQDDLELINRSGQGRVDVSIGSALDLFGGKLSYEEVVFWHLQQRSSS